MQCEKRVYNITTSRSEVGGESVWCMCSTRRVASAVRGEGYVVQRESVQYQKCFISSRRTGCVV